MAPMRGPWECFGAGGMGPATEALNHPKPHKTPTETSPAARKAPSELLEGSCSPSRIGRCLPPPAPNQPCGKAAGEPPGALCFPVGLLYKLRSPLHHCPPLKPAARNESRAVIPAAPVQAPFKLRSPLCCCLERGSSLPPVLNLPRDALAPTKPSEPGFGFCSELWKLLLLPSRSRLSPVPKPRTQFRPRRPEPDGNSLCWCNS